MSNFQKSLSKSNEKISNVNYSTISSDSINAINSTSSKMSASLSNSSSNSNKSSIASSINSLIENSNDELSNLTNLVKNFREQLSKLRKLINNEVLTKANHQLEDKEKNTNLDQENTCQTNLGLIKDWQEKREILKAQTHDKLADVLRVLKLIFEKYPQIQSSELFISAKTLIESVKAFNYLDANANVLDLLEIIEQLAVSFSNKVSEYLMENNYVSNQKKNNSLQNSSNNYISRSICDNNNNISNHHEIQLNPSSNISNLNNNQTNSNDFLWVSMYNKLHKKVFSDANANTNKKDDLPVNENFFCQLSSDEFDLRFVKMNDVVDLVLNRAKLWSKYAKDITNYIEKRINFEIEYSKNILKLAQTMKPIFKESENLPLQNLYDTALEQDIENFKAYFANCTLILGHKFIEPLVELRNKHSKIRKASKSQWNREYKKLHESINNLRKSKAYYVSKHLELERAKQALKAIQETNTANNSQSSNISSLSNNTFSNVNTNLFTNTNQSYNTQTETANDQSKLDKKRKCEEDANTKAIDAENAYRNAVSEANERAYFCENVKNDILNRIQELNYKCDLTLKSITKNYFQIQQSITSAEPVQFEMLLEELNSFEPGIKYNEYISKINLPLNQNKLNYFTFVPYEYINEFNQMDFTAGNERNNLLCENINETSCSQERSTNLTSSLSPTIRRCQPLSEFNVLDSYNLVNFSDDSNENEKILDSRDSNEVATVSSGSNKKQIFWSKTALTHNFKTAHSLSKCKECEIVNFQGLECTQCGLCIHKKCISTLTIRCGFKPLNRKMSSFGVDLCSQSINNEVPFLVRKCIQELNRKGLSVKGLYRISGVKSKIEKLCQDFEIGGELVDLTGIQPNVIASVLKLYFRQLSEPLLTFRLYSEFILIGKHYPSVKIDVTLNDDSSNAIRLSNSTQSLLKELKHTINKLPEVHLNTLDYLMKHLKKVSDNPLCNMPANNLGIVFGPTLLRANEDSASLSTLVDTVHQTRVVELLILNYNELFGGNLVEDNDINENENENEELENELIDNLKKNINLIQDDEGIENEIDLDLDLDILVSDLNKPKPINKSFKISKTLSEDSNNFEFKDSKTHFYSNFDKNDFIKEKTKNDLQNEDTITKASTSKILSSRPFLYELRKQFFNDTTSSSSQFSSIPSSFSEDKEVSNYGHSSNTQVVTAKLIEKKNLFTSDQKKMSSSSVKKSLPISSSHNFNTPNIKKKNDSPKSSTLHLLNTKNDNREPKFV